MTGEKFYISSSPHIVSNRTTNRMMKDTVIALIPAVIASIYFFRFRAAILILISCISCILCEALIQVAMKKEITVNDWSAAVTGILFAMVMPPGTPLWMVILGAIIAIGLGKQLFGGLGANIFNPALLARAFLMAAFPVYLTRWNEPFTLDAVTQATPLGLAKFGHSFPGGITGLFIGNIPGSLGETSAIALIAGGVYLLAKKVIDWRIPSGYIGAVFIISFLFNLIFPEQYTGALFHIFAGGLILGAFFMATDPVTSPVTKSGRWVFGIGCGIITMVIRYWSGLPEGVMYSILLMNALTPILNKITRPRRFGV